MLDYLQLALKHADPEQPMAMSELLAEHQFAELDHVHLSEYLADMAKRDRREVFSRLVVLISHLLRWQHQPTGRCGSWRGTIREQRRELR